MADILCQKPGVLNGTYKLARSFLDSMLQSDAVLTMTPQQQALCAVCHALEKHGMPQQAVLQRYASHASADAERQQAVVQQLQVCISAAARANCHFDRHMLVALIEVVYLCIQSLRLLQTVWGQGVSLADAGHTVCSKYSQKGASPKELDMKVWSPFTYFYPLAHGIVFSCGH